MTNLHLALPIGGALLLLITALFQKGRWFETALYGLVALNVALYTLWGTLSEGIDALGWFVLLTLFRLETAGIAALQSPGVKTAMQTVRLLCALLIVWACYGFWSNGEVLDGLSSLFWILLVGVLELLLRAPARVKTLKALAGLLFAGLGGVALVWAFMGEWVDAYDALLWILAFLTIERGAAQLANRPDTPQP